ncbi:MAG: pseudouridine synthase [Pseudomonadota bacterium]
MSRRPDPAEDTGEKIQKVLAAAGVASRRQLESWITAGRVKVNGVPAHIGQRVKTDDKIEVDERRIRLARATAGELLIMNKAAGVVCSRADPEGRPTVFDELPTLKQGRWISVGRLDLQTSGLLLMTNDGTLANKLTHPSTGLDREYAVRVGRRLEDEELELLMAGVESEGEMLRFSDIQYYDGTDNNTWYHVVLMEGKNREVRRLFEAVGCTVSRLKRVRYGPVVLPSWLRHGRWATMTTADVRKVYRMLNLPYQAPKRAPGKASKLARTTCLLPYPKLNSSR